MLIENPHGLSPEQVDALGSVGIETLDDLQSSPLEATAELSGVPIEALEAALSPANESVEDEPVPEPEPVAPEGDASNKDAEIAALKARIAALEANGITDAALEADDHLIQAAWDALTPGQRTALNVRHAKMQPNATMERYLNNILKGCTRHAKMLSWAKSSDSYYADYGRNWMKAKLARVADSALPA